MSKDRKQIILQSLAKLLEERDATKVTTAVLASESGITEAALYRHFPSKRSIFLELLSEFTFSSFTNSLEFLRINDNCSKLIFLFFIS